MASPALDPMLNLVATAARLEQKVENLQHTLNAVVETIQEQQQEIDSLTSVLGRWKTAGSILLILGAVGAWFVDKAVDIFLK